MTVLLALVSALCYGCSDFAAGLAARRTSVWAVTVVVQASATVLLALASLVTAGSPTGADLLWAALGGVGSGVGAGFLYRGLSSGQMSVIAPVSGVGAAVVPVLAGLAGGERPGWLVWLGIVAAFPAIWLVSAAPREEGAESRLGDGVRDGLLAGLGFGVLFACLGQVPDGSGTWPLAVNLAVSTLAVVALALVLRGDPVPRDRRVLVGGLVPGILSSGAALTFLLASQQGYLSVAGVLASLYPAATVVLALLVLRERVTRWQSAGLALAVVSVVLVAGG
ncbi:multidrug transporter [Marmoricola endophyticus]|uniref:Multidrug transporter n=1 Tax=Marmoricola endophyticus TaxID=2040280 RepID=A0A917EXZ5_9ACTN|nr:DMT family transporter [Marmoricola endophyticus]GGF32534.1 multidrug transporter [Marmoricola endophyticus]